MKDWEITMVTKEGRQYFEYCYQHANSVMEWAARTARDKGVSIKNIRQMGAGEYQNV